MLTDSPLYARMGNDVAAVVRFDGAGFSVEVGCESDPESFESVEYHADLLSAAIALVDIVKHTVVCDPVDAEEVCSEL